MKRFCLLALAAAPLAVAQLDSNSVTVTATRAALARPDQVLFFVGATASPEVTLTQILDSLQKVGITNENLAGIRIAPPALFGGREGFAWLWQFTLPVPLAGMQDAVRALTGLQQSPDTASRGLRVSFSVIGVQSSPAVLRSLDCPTAALIADARAQGQKMANAAGAALGAILAIAQMPPPALAGGSFSASGGDFSFPTVETQITPPVAVCSVSVRFRLGG
jgi:hypothetical protein